MTTNTNLGSNLKIIWRIHRKHKEELTLYLTDWKRFIRERCMSLSYSYQAWSKKRHLFWFTNLYSALEMWDMWAHAVVRAGYVNHLNGHHKKIQKHDNSDNITHRPVDNTCVGYNMFWRSALGKHMLLHKRVMVYSDPINTLKDTEFVI